MRGLRRLSVVVVSAVLGLSVSAPVSAQVKKWQSLPGKSLDIGVGHNGTVWSIGPNRQAWRLDGKKWVKFSGLTDLQNIDGAPDGSVMAARKDGTLHYHSGKKGARWQKAGVRTMDVGIGGGWVWLTNTQRASGGGQIWRSRYTPGKWKWQRVPGNLMRLDVDPKGNAWGVNDKNDIYRYDGKKWVKVEGKALDLGIGGDGTIWGVASRDYNAGAGGGSVWKYNPKIKGGWVNGNGRLQRISVDPRGKPYGANVQQKVWRDASATGATGGGSAKPPAKKKPVASKKPGKTTLSTAQTKQATDLINALIKRMPLAPSAAVSTVKSLVGSVKLVSGTNYYSANKGNVYVFVERPGATKNSGGGTSAFLLIKGRITPNLPNKFLNNFKGSDLSDLILSAVKTHAKELNKGKRKREEISLKDLPPALRAVVKKQYKDNISFPAGFQAAAAIELKGLFAGAVKAIGLPNKNLTLRLGMEQPEYSLSGNAPEPDDNTFYAELIRHGAWKKPFNLDGTTIWDTTVGINTDLIMKVVGYGHVNKGNNFVLYYDGPVPRKNVPPDDVKKIAFAFGAHELSYKQYLNLMLSFQIPMTGSKKLAFVDGVSGFSNAMINGVKKGVNALPLDTMKITQAALKNLKPKQGEFPPPKYYSVQAVGPKGKLGEEEGPLIRLNGAARALGMNVAAFKGELSKSGMKATGKVGDTLSLGVFGRAGMSGTLDTQLDAKRQFFGVTGKVKAGKLGGRDFLVDLKPTQARFSSDATCAYPFDVSAGVKITDPRKISLKNLPFKPLNAVPDAGKMIKCGAGLLYAIKDGVVYAFKGGKKVAEFADKLMQKNEATKLASGAVKFASGKTVKAAGEAAKLIKADKAAAGAKKAAEAAKKAAAAAARESAKRAKQAAAEAARQAREAAQAAKLAANLTKDIAKNVAGSVGKQFSNALSGVGSAVTGMFKKKSKSPPRPPNANDCGAAEYWNHTMKRCMTRGYQMLVDTRKGSKNPRCLEIINAVVHNGQHVQTFACKGGWWQQWRRMPNGEIRTPNGRCLDGKNLKVGEHVHTWTCHNGKNQKWTIDARGRLRTSNGLCAIPNPKWNNYIELVKCPRLASNKREWTGVTLFEDYHRKYGLQKEYLIPIHMYGERACHAENHLYACNVAPAYRNRHLVYTFGFVNAHQFALVNAQKKTCISTDANRNGRNAFGGRCDYRPWNLWTAQPVASNGNIAGGNHNPRHMLNGVFVFRNVHNGLCLTSKLGNVDNGARWSLKRCNLAKHPTQRVKLRGVGTPNRRTWTHRTVNTKLAIGQQCLTTAASRANNAGVGTYNCKKRRVQGAGAVKAKLNQFLAHQSIRHSIEYLDDTDYFVIRVRFENGAKCFDVDGGSTVSGKRIIQYPCHRAHNQQWSAVSWRGDSFLVKNRKSGLCMQRQNNGAMIQTTCRSGSGAQRVRLIR